MGRHKGNCRCSSCREKKGLKPLGRKPKNKWDEVTKKSIKILNKENKALQKNLKRLDPEKIEARAQIYKAKVIKPRMLEVIDRTCLGCKVEIVREANKIKVVISTVKKEPEVQMFDISRPHVIHEVTQNAQGPEES